MKCGKKLLSAISVVAMLATVFAGCFTFTASAASVTGATVADDDDGFVFFDGDDVLSSNDYCVATGSPTIVAETGELPDGTAYSGVSVTLPTTGNAGVGFNNGFSLNLGRYNPAQYSYDFWLYVNAANAQGMVLRIDANTGSGYGELCTPNDGAGAIRNGRVVNFVTGDKLQAGWNHVIIPMNCNQYASTLYADENWQDKNITAVRIWNIGSNTAGASYKIANFRLTKTTSQALGKSEVATYNSSGTSDYTTAAVATAAELGLKKVSACSITATSGAKVVVQDVNGFNSLTSEEFASAKLRFWYYYDSSNTKNSTEVSLEISSSSSSDASEIQYTLRIPTMAASGLLTEGWNQIEFPLFAYGADAVSYMEKSWSTATEGKTTFGVSTASNNEGSHWVRIASITGTMDPTALRRIRVFYSTANDFDIALADFEIVVETESATDNTVVSFDASTTKTQSQIANWNSATIAKVGTIGTDVPAATVEGGPTEGTVYMTQASSKQSGIYIKNLNIDLTPLYNDPTNYEFYMWVYIDDYSKVNTFLTRWFLSSDCSGNRMMQFGSAIGKNMYVNGTQVSGTLSTAAPSGWFRLSWKMSDMVQGATNFLQYGDVQKTLHSLIFADWGAGSAVMALAEVGVAYTGSDRVDDNTATVINDNAGDMTIRYTAAEATTLTIKDGDKVVAEVPVEAANNKQITVSFDRYVSAGDVLTFEGAEVSRYTDYASAWSRSLHTAPITAQNRTEGTQGLKFNFGIDVKAGNTFVQSGKTYTVERFGALLIPTEKLGDAALTLAAYTAGNGVINDTKVANVKVTGATVSEENYTEFSATVTGIPEAAESTEITAVAYVVTTDGAVFYSDTVSTSVAAVMIAA